MITTDPKHPDLKRGGDTEPGPQSKAYLVLSDEERAKGFIRPVRASYRHVGERPKYPLRDLTDEENVLYADVSYVKFEEYPKGSPALGRYWTQAQLDKKTCGTVTTMGRELAETYAREPGFYGATYCCGCSMHLPVSEFVWDGTTEVVGS